MQGIVRNAARHTPAALLFVAALPVAAADLLIHNGFQACWSQAVTKPQFLAALQSAIDGATSCIPSQTATDTTRGITYTVCGQTQCGGNPGCPVVLHAGPFAGDFATGQFNATGTANDIVASVEYAGGSLPPGACTITISAITLAYAPRYEVGADGNDGAYMASLAGTGVTVTGSSVSGSNFTCSLLAASYGAQLKSQAEASANALVAVLLAPTVGESVCPLLP